VVAQDTQSKSLNISRISCVKEALVIHQNEEREQSRAMQKKKQKKK